MDDPVSQLANYKLQLGQVEAALTADENNEELLTLRKDLDEIIEITEALIEETKQQVKMTEKTFFKKLLTFFGNY